jgi:predicted TPR repeat methyltransferase
MDIVFNLALCQKKIGDWQGAIVSYKKVLQAEPENIDTLYNLAGCYMDSGLHDEAIVTYLEVLKFAPDHASANNNLAYMCHRTGDGERAAYYYEKVLNLNPENQGAKHMLAALTGSTATSSPESFVREVFDNYSGHYEQSLITELEYCVPSSIRSLLDQTPGSKKKYSLGLDLGCGTGLGGQAFVDMIDILDGIDLSEKMISRAAEKKIYRRLYSGDIAHYLRASKEYFDFYLAADVFAYVGDLEETFALLRKRARQDVLFCFSTEREEGDGYKLRQTGRFGHSRSYIEELALATGWQVEAAHSTSLRKENGVWVEGDLWFLVLPAKN